MQFDKNKNPAAAVKKGQEWESTAHVGMVAVDGRDYACSTDGRMAVLVAAEMEGETPEGVYPVAAFDAARKATATDRATLSLNGSATVFGSGTSWPAHRLAFPDIQHVVPKGEPSTTVTLDAARLATIQKALGADGVEVEIRADGAPLVVRPVYLKDGKGKGSADGSFGILAAIAR